MSSFDLRDFSSWVARDQFVTATCSVDDGDGSPGFTPARFQDRLSMVIKLNPPAPFGPISRIPPGKQDPDLAAGENYRSADVIVCGPAIFAMDLFVFHCQACHRPVSRAR